MENDMPENMANTGAGSPTLSKTQNTPESKQTQDTFGGVGGSVWHINIDDLDPIKQQRRNAREFARERREGWSYGE